MPLKAIICPENFQFLFFGGNLTLQCRQQAALAPRRRAAASSLSAGKNLACDDFLSVFRIDPSTVISKNPVYRSRPQPNLFQEFSLLVHPAAGKSQKSTQRKKDLWNEIDKASSRLHNFYRCFLAAKFQPLSTIPQSKLQADESAIECRRC